MPTSPRRSTGGAPSDIRRGRRPRRPAIGETAPTFCAVSGSGAGRQTILSLGTVLPKIPLVDEKGSPETIRFLARFWVLFPRGKSARRGQEKPIQLPFPPKKQSRTSHALLCSSHASSQNIEPQHHDAEDNQHNPRRAVERLRRGLIREHRRDPRPEQRKDNTQQTDSPVRHAADHKM